MHKRVKINADILCKYVLEVQIEYCSEYFNDELIKHKTNKVIKTISNNNNYYITSNPTNVVSKYSKKFLFSTNLPFKYKEKIITNNLEKTFVEIVLINITNYILEIKDVNFLMDNLNISSINENSDLLNLNINLNNNINTNYTNNTREQIKIQDFVKSENDFIINNNNNNTFTKEISNSLLIEPEEEINFSFSISNYRAFINSVIKLKKI
jgi:hypothetical protein